MLIAPAWMVVAILMLANVSSAIQEIMPNQVRAFASSIFLFVLNLIALAMGPSLVAAFTDFVFMDEGMLKYIFFTMNCRGPRLYCNA